MPLVNKNTKKIQLQNPLASSIKSVSPALEPSVVKAESKIKQGAFLQIVSFGALMQSFSRSLLLLVSNNDSF